VGYLRETRSDRRHPSVVALCARLWQEGLLDNLAFSDRVLANHDLVNDLLRLGRTADAEEILLQSRELFENSEDDQKLKEAPHLSALMRRLADRWEARGDFRRALTLLEDVREDLQSALSLPDQAQLLNDVGWLQYRLADYQQSMESCRLSLNTLNAQQYPLIVAQALNLMGVVHLYTSRYDEAISYFERSAYLRERSGDENLLAASYNNFALVYQAKGDFEKALDYHNKSLNLKKRQNNRAGIAAGYLNLALLHLESRNFKEAETKCRESLEICGELGNTQLIADNTITLGDIALEGDDFEAAERQYDEARRMSKEQGAINEEMGALRRLASLCIKRERFDEAREHADNAHELVKRIGSKYEEAQIEVILGDLELEQKRHLEALDHFERAATQYSSLSKYRLGATVLSKIGLIHAENGNNFEARHYLERAQEYGRADIGRELPEEFVKLQHALRAHHAPSLVTGQESQKLLMAFYDLSAMTDYALDPKEFLRKVMEITRRIADPIDCYLGLKVGESYMVLDGSGESVTSHPSNIDRAFDRALTLGRLIDSGSADAAEVNDALTLPSDRAFVAVPLKAMGEDLACMFFLFQQERVPLSKEDVNFFTWLGRQIAGNLKLMLNLNENFLKAEGSTHQTTRLQTAAPSEQHRFKDLIGKSETMKKIFRTLEKVRDTDASILIMGESGTGKSALAAAAHYNSPRSNRPFQEIHCAQIPHNLLESELFGHERGSFTGAVQRKLGLCEMANGGTLFLDDINVMPVETQTKLLHFLESKSFHRLGGTQRLTADVRIIAASNEDLETLCREGRFREDLFYRLKVILIDLPPLRERKEDMIAIALQYLKRSCTEKGIPLKTLAPETIQLLQKAPWRGNVRELQNVLERVVVLSDEDVITPSSLPDDFLREVMGTSRKSHERLDELIDEIIKLGNYSETNPLLRTLEAMLAKRMVEHVEGKGHAASLLGVSKPTLYARLRDYDKMS
jgi:two-component system nitrogen regulation response regulator GlnG